MNMKQNTVNTASKYVPSLVHFGLSIKEAETYSILSEKGPLPVNGVAHITKSSPNALYRILKNLLRKGLIIASPTHPAIYRTISPAIAFDALAKKQISTMEITKNELIQSLTAQQPHDQTKIDLIGNIRDFFLAYAKLAHKAKEEILIISIGEEVPEEVVLANRDCIERGIKIRFIVHKYDAGNRNLVHRWIRMGMEVRHYPDWGFHLVVIDKKVSLLAVNDPKNTSDRVSLQFNSEGLSKALGDYFYTTWDKASPVQ